MAGIPVKKLGRIHDGAGHQRTRDALTPEDPIHELAGGGLLVEQLDVLPETASTSPPHPRARSFA